MIIALIIIAALLALYLLALRGRTKHPLLRKLRKWNYAHRGLHGNGSGLQQVGESVDVNTMFHMS